MAVLTIGPIGNLVSHAIGIWEEHNPGKSAAHYDMRFLKPIDTSILNEIGKKYDRIITVENGVITGGMGSAVMEFMAMNGYTPNIVRLGLPDRFVTHGSVPQLLHLCNLDEDAVIAALNGKDFKPLTQES